MTVEQHLLKKNLKRKRKSSFNELKATLAIATDDDLMTQITELLEKELSGFNFNLDPRRYKFFFTCFEYLEYAPGKLNLENDNTYHNVSSRLIRLIPMLENMLEEPCKTVWKDKYELNKDIIMKVMARIQEYNYKYNQDEEFYVERLYNVIREIVFEVKEVNHLKKITLNMPYVKELKNNKGIPLIQDLVERYFELIKDGKDQFNLLYFERAVNLFTTINPDKETLNVIRHLVIELNDEIKNNDELSDETKEQWLVHLSQISRGLKFGEIDGSYANNLYAKYMTKRTFPIEILRAVDDVQDQEDMAKDYRNRYVITIDDYNCKAPEDAVSLTVLPNQNYELCLYITDVDHFIKHGSILDLEALKRAVSTQNKYESLFPRELVESKLALYSQLDSNVLAFTFVFDDQAKLISSKVEQAVINVAENLNNHDVKNIINDKDGKETYQMLRHLYNLTTTLKYASDDPNVSLAERFDTMKIKNPKIYELIVPELAVFLNTFIGTYFYENNLPLIFRNDDNSKNEQAIEIVNKELKGTEEGRLLTELINSVVPPMKLSPVNNGFRRLQATGYACISNPVRMYDSYLNQKYVKCFMLNKETEYTEFNDYYEHMMPYICECMNKNNQISSFQKEDVGILRREEYKGSKRLTKRK